MTVRRIVTAGTAVLAACGLLAMAPAAVQASSASDPTWTRQTPAVHPGWRGEASMAYDAATSTAVLFGGIGAHRVLSDTWTWDGSTWTQQHPAVHPSARRGASMAYDAATGTVVLFGGCCKRGSLLSDTWTWDGSTWTQQHPAVHPPARYAAAMAYDAATGTVVLFSGCCKRDGSLLSATWTWDGSTWTQQHPPTSPAARFDASMAYDAATGTAVLFGGDDNHSLRADTWTWDGTTWTQQAPAASPSGRYAAAMAYDDATGTVLLFSGSGPGGSGSTGVLSDTWTWDGSTWTQQHPATSPPPARFEAAMTYDTATGTAVLFGGGSRHVNNYLSDTWTWG